MSQYLWRFAPFCLIGLGLAFGKPIAERGVVEGESGEARHLRELAEFDASLVAEGGKSRTARRGPSRDTDAGTARPASHPLPRSAPLGSPLSTEDA